MTADRPNSPESDPNRPDEANNPAENPEGAGAAGEAATGDAEGAIAPESSEPESSEPESSTPESSEPESSTPESSESDSQNAGESSAGESGQSDASDDPGESSGDQWEGVGASDEWETTRAIAETPAPTEPDPGDRQPVGAAAGDPGESGPAEDDPGAAWLEELPDDVRRASEPAPTPAPAPQEAPPPLGQQLKRLLVLVLKAIVAVLEWTIAELEAGPPQFDAEPAEGAEPAPPRGWAAVLARLRDRLPEPARSLSDRTLTLTLGGAVAGVLVLAIAVLSPGGSESEVAVAPSPPPESVEAPAEPSAELPTEPPAAELPDERPPGAKIAPAPRPEPAPEPAPEPQSSPAPLEPEEPPAEPKPAPKLDLTPEQSLIAAIQDRVSDIADRYDEADIVAGVQADFQFGRLAVKVKGDGWAALTPRDRRRFARDMLARSRELDFSKLEILDEDGTLLARSPVVGPDPVIYDLSPSLAAQ